jgi:type I restriction enzyme M protein
VEKWKHRKEQTVNDRGSKFFWVSKKEIEKNDFDLSSNRYKETEYEEVKYEDPEVILEKIETLEAEIVAGINDLKVN